MVKRNLARMRHTVANSLYYVKDREVSWDPLEITDVVEGTVKAIALRAENAGIAVQKKVVPGAFEGDMDSLRALLVNLAEFAVEAYLRAEAGSDPSFTLTAAIEEPNVVFELQAAGLLLEKGVVERAQADHYAPKGSDRSHLSLFIAHRIVRRLRGALLRERRCGRPAGRWPGGARSRCSCAPA